MDIKAIDKTVSVASQITPDDVLALKEQGFRAIICNRPDGEAGDQPTFEDIKRAAVKHGLEARYIPIVGANMREADARAFEAELRDLPGPVLAYCRSGTRSAMLWSLAMINSKPVDDILAATQAAGYDTSGVVAERSDPATD